MTYQALALSSVLLAIGGCGGSDGPTLPDGTYSIGSASCETGTLTAAGEAFNAAIASRDISQSVVIEGGLVAIATTNDDGTTPTDYCIVSVSGTLSYSGDLVTVSTGAGSWEAVGSGLSSTCPTDIAAQSYSYSFVVDAATGNIGTVAQETDNPSYSSAYCTSGKVGRTYERNSSE
jgi:hypothetical protein